MFAVLRWLRDLVSRFRPFFFWLWIGGLLALAPLSLLPETTPPTGIAGVELSLDKVFHFVAYGGLAGLAVLLFGEWRRRCAALCVVLLAGLGYEIGQIFVPGRSFGFDDLSANAAGVVIGAALAWWVSPLPARVALARS